jgi:hypothetical protein
LTKLASRALGASGALLIVWCLAQVSLIPIAVAQDFGDAPYVQSSGNVVKAMLDSAKVGPEDFVIDLGSGDGRMVITAAKQYGARGFGVDHDERLVRIANANAAKAGVADRAVFYARDLYKTEIRRASVISMYLLPEVNLMVRPKLFRELQPGTRIVSHDYDMGEWKPDAQLILDVPDKPVGREKISKVFYWVVPANVTGDWVLVTTTGTESQEYALKLTQLFQFAEGAIESGGAKAALEEVKLNGAQLTIKAHLPDESASASLSMYEFSGHVMGDSMQGTIRSDPAKRAISWRARRVAGRTVIGPEVDPGLAEIKALSGVQ